MHSPRLSFGPTRPPEPQRRDTSRPGLLALLAATLVSTAAAAEESHLVVEGMLRDQSGVPIDDGGNPFTLIFSLYATQGSASALWTESLNTIPIRKGYFQARLGSLAGSALPVTLFEANPTLWLGVKVAGQTEFQRTALETDPYAFRARSAAKADDAAAVGGFSAAAAPTAGKLLVLNGVGQVPASAVPVPTALNCSGCLTGAHVTDGSLMLGDLNRSGCNTGQVIQWNGSQFACAGPFVTSVTAGTGLSGGTISGSGTIALLPPSVTALGGVLAKTCGPGEVATGIAATGTLSCAPARTYVAGEGLTLDVSSSAFAIDPTVVPRLGTSNTFAHINTFKGPWMILGPSGSGPGETTGLRFRELAAQGPETVGFKAPDNVTQEVTWTLPAADGTSGQLLGTDGTGKLGWKTPPGLSWTSVTSGGVSAGSNVGYIAQSDAVPIVVTLPASPAVGDIVRVTGAGAAGWKVVQNAGQSIQTLTLDGVVPGSFWLATNVYANWYAITSSSDGTKLAAVAYGGKIHTSSDSGQTWAARDSDRFWSDIASSADGSKLVATVYFGFIYTSTDSGQTWTPRPAPGSRAWKKVTSSADGTKLMAVPDSGFVYTSSDSGQNWTARLSDANRNWSSAASSADGTTLLIGESSAMTGTSGVWLSSNSGVDWTVSMYGSSWTGLATSGDGTMHAAVSYASFTSAGLWSFTGGFWTQRLGQGFLRDVASSADGSRLLVAEETGRLRVSADSGLTWQVRDINRNWWGVASSADGSKLAAVVNGGYIYISKVATSPGAAGGLLGLAGAAVELQYAGQGRFVPISRSGSVTPF